MMRIDKPGRATLWAWLLLIGLLAATATAGRGWVSAETTTPSDGAVTYLPLIFVDYPPIPATPVLNDIANPDKDGFYSVTWQSADLAETYILEEDDNSSFTSPTVVHDGPATSWGVSNKPYGTYYYRVKAHNQFGDSLAYSAVKSVVVARFYVDSAALTVGQCTGLHWDFVGIQALYVSFIHGADRVGVFGQDGRTVCPSITTTYTALVVFNSTTSELHDVTVTVTGTGCSTDPYIERFEPTKYTVKPGEKFSYFWDVECAGEVWLKVGALAEKPVEGHGSVVDATLTTTTQYTLRVRKGTQDYYKTFTVTVQP